jgi:hypothetical protein
MKIIILMVTLTGCSTFQPSHYSNYNTPYGNVVTASGVAANNAAIVNTSSNCPSCTVGGSHSSSGGVTDYNTAQDAMGRITEQAMQTTASQLGYTINNAISRMFSGIRY